MNLPALLAPVLAVASLAAQSTIHVPTEAPTIGSAIAVATSGDTISVAPGIYFEHDLDFGGRNLVLRSTAGPDATYLHSGGLGRLLHFQNGETANAVVDGFTLVGGRAPNGTAGGPSVDGTPGAHGGAIRIVNASPTIRRCVFLDNRAGHGGAGGDGNDGWDGDPATDGQHGGHGGDGGCGGAISIDGGAPRILSCAFTSNRAGDASYGGDAGDGGDGDDGGIFGAGGDGGSGGDGGDGGDGGSGGAVCLLSGSVEIVNCSFWQNLSGGPGNRGSGGDRGLGGSGVPSGTDGEDGANGMNGVVLGGSALDDRASGMSIRNSIVWANSGFPIRGTPTIGYSDVQGGFAGVGNFDSDPQWTYPGSHRLDATSPCIGAGDPSPAGLSPLDLDGEPRVAGAVVDIGPDEFVPAATVASFGCGVNPPGSLSWLAGRPSPGENLVLGVDNPLGTQAQGSFAFVLLTPFQAPLYPCGVVVPGFGMAGPGAGGEALVDLATATVQIDSLWYGPGTPAPAILAIPADPGLYGVTFYAQGLMLDPVAAQGVGFGFTNGIEFVVGI